LFHLFTSHMSGNTTGAGVQLGQHAGAEACRLAFPIPLFVIGVVVGAALTEGLARRGRRSTFAAVLGVEAVLLGLFMVWGHTVLTDGVLRRDSGVIYYSLAALPALAMGMQNAALRRVGGVTTRTTFVTGTLSSAGEEFTTFLFWLRDHCAGRSLRRRMLVLRLSVRQASWNRVLVLFSIWGSYFGGAVLGTAAKLQWELWCLLIPLVGLACLIVCDLVHPFSAMPPSRASRPSASAAAP
jgi:uncharacterized membrane protein YoaK (UPF0700 family)